MAPKRVKDGHPRIFDRHHDKEAQNGKPPGCSPPHNAATDTVRAMKSEADTEEADSAADVSQQGVQTPCQAA